MWEAINIYKMSPLDVASVMADYLIKSLHDASKIANRGLAEAVLEKSLRLHEIQYGRYIEYKAINDIDEIMVKIGDVGLDGGDIYTVVDDVIKKFGVYRNYINLYNKFIEMQRRSKYSPLNEKMMQEHLVMLGKLILARSVELAPFKTGFLRKSARLVVYPGVVKIEYTAPYAYFVHEILGNYHLIGQAKFLERALLEIIPDTSWWTEEVDSGGLSVTLTLHGKFLTFRH